MSMWLRFVYDAARDAVFEEPPASMEELALFDIETKFLEPVGFEVSALAKEYEREQTETETRWRERYNIRNLDDINNLEDPAAFGELMWTGPSQPFSPEEVRDWASQWLILLAELPIEVLQIYGLDRGAKQINIDLQDIIRQADCAERHGVRMRFEVV